MKATQWMILIAGAVISLSPSLTAAQADDEMREGIDVESPEKIEQARQEIERQFADAVQPEMMNDHEKLGILARYQFVDPHNEVPTDLLEKALVYLDKNKSKFPNQEYISIVDFKPRSDKYRFFIVNVKTGAVEKYHTTHGLHSDENKDGYAERFGNVKNSGRSSLGYVRTAGEYNGKFGRAVRLDGLSTTNSNVRARAIVLHGWKKAYERNVIQGLSWGCITMDYSVHNGIIDKLKAGSLMLVGISTKK